jgi:hypothetical protein
MFVLYCSIHLNVKKNHLPMKKQRVMKRKAIQRMRLHITDKKKNSCGNNGELNSTHKKNQNGKLERHNVCQISMEAYVLIPVFDF